MFEKFIICFVSLYIYDLLCVVVYIFTDYINCTKMWHWTKTFLSATKKDKIRINSFTFTLQTLCQTHPIFSSPIISGICVESRFLRYWGCPGDEYCSPLSSLKLDDSKVPFLPLFWDDYCYQQQTGMPLRSFYDATDSTTSTELSRDWIVLWVKVVHSATLDSRHLVVMTHRLKIWR